MTVPPSSTSPELRLSLRFGDAAAVAVAGELDLSTVAEFSAVLQALVDRGHERITVECDELAFIDVSGLGALITARTRLDASHGELRVRGLSRAAHRLFEITDLVDVFHAQVRDDGHDADPGDPDSTDRLVSQVADLLIDAASADALSALLALAPVLVVGCDRGSITLRRDGELITAAASDETARHLDSIQYADRDGPCVDAAHAGVQIHAPTLADEHRWPTFTTEARQRDVDSALSSPLLLAEQPIGALNLYSSAGMGFEPSDRERASLLAELAALVAGGGDRRAPHELEARIRDALKDRDLISRAQGILMERRGIDADSAHESLRRESAATSVPLRERAARIVQEAQPTGDPTDPEAAHG